LTRGAFRAVTRRVLFAFLPLVAATDAFARAGGGGGYHGGGGFSSGGSHGSGGGGGGAGYLVYLYLQALIEHPLIMIPLTLLGIWIYIQINARGKSGPEDTIESLPASMAGVYADQAGASRNGALAQIRSRDPGFDEAAFLSRASGAFLAIQQAWSDQDMAKARAFISDGVYERFTRQIAEQKARGVRNRMTDVNVLSCEAAGYLAGPHFDSVYVRVRAEADDAMVSLQEGGVLSEERGSFEEIWTFLRRPGAKTLARPGLLEGQCPSCGAPLAIADAAQCAACKAWVNSGEHDWVLVKITQATEWAFPNPGREVSGWEEMRETDPGLSLESLEDRASVTFWRWLDARRRQDAAPLRGVACDDFLKTLQFDGSFESDGAVGAVETMAFQSAADFDRAHVQVRWEAERFENDGSGPRSRGRQRKTHFLIFRRKAGASSDLKAGLRTARCPACGAPPAEPDAAACAYCGHAFNDGSRQWVLAEIVAFGVWRRPDAPAAAPMAVVGLDWGENLPPVEAVAVLALGLSADGVVNDAEKAYLTAYAAKRGVTPAVTDQLLQSALNRELDLPPPTDGAQAESILRGLIRMELADGVITEAELALLSAYAKRVGLQDADVGAMVKEERLTLQERAAARRPA
jgi:hypothetical protein